MAHLNPSCDVRWPPSSRRCADARAPPTIEGHTARIGHAERNDGLSFTRRSAPVLYPDRDEQRQYEWSGAVEDPRFVESFFFFQAEDGIRDYKVTGVQTCALPI